MLPTNIMAIARTALPSDYHWGQCGVVVSSDGTTAHHLNSGNCGQFDRDWYRIIFRRSTSEWTVEMWMLPNDSTIYDHSKQAKAPNTVEIRSTMAPYRRIATIEKPDGDRDARRMVVWASGDEAIVYGYVGAIPLDTLSIRRSQAQALIEALQKAIGET